MHKFRRLTGYARRERPTLAVIIVLALLSAAVAVLQPWPLKLLVDYAIGPLAFPQWLQDFFASLHLPMSPWVLIPLAALASLGLFALNSALHAGLTLAWAAAGQRMMAALATDLLHRLQRLSLSFHNQRSVGDSLSRLTDDTWCVYTITESLLVAPLQHLLTLAIVGAVAWRLDPTLAAWSLVVAPVLGASALIFGRRLKHRARLNREAQSRLLSFVQQTLGAVPVVQAFGREASNRARFRALADDASALTQRAALWRSSFTFVNGLTTTVGTAVILYIGGRQAIAGTLSIGSLLVFLGYLRSLQGACQGLLGTFGTVKSAEASVERVLEVLDAPDAVRESPTPRPLPAQSLGAVRLDNVTFGYEPDRPILRGVSFALRPGEMVALVGPTGAGKSTLAALLMRLYDPQQGRVLFDEIDARELRTEDLRSQIAMLLQEPFLLAATVAQNIGFGRRRAGRSAIEAAAVAANADAFIRDLPGGYDTQLGERGAMLSGGQRQRLAIARALLKNAPVLILDEPTSALDAQTEAQVMEALERLMRGRTTLIIAHRLATIRRADRIAVLDHGEIVEVGTHDELLAAGGLYARLHASQFLAEKVA